MNLICNMKTLLAASLLATSVLSQDVTDYDTFDTVGLLRPADASTTYQSVYANWAYPTDQLYDSGPTGGPGVWWFTQYVSLDLLPVGNGQTDGPLSTSGSSTSSCTNFLQVGTNVTLTQSGSSTAPFVESGWAFYTLDNKVTPITLSNGSPYVFSKGDSVSVKVNVTSSTATQTVFAVTLVTSNSGTLTYSLSTKTPLCLKNVQWALGTREDKFLPGFNNDYYIYNAQAQELHTSGALTTVYGTDALRQILILSGGNIQADVGEITQTSFWVEFEPDCLYEP